MIRNITPYMARKTSTMPPVPVLNAGLRKYRMSSIGSRRRSSQRQNTASTTSTIANAPIVSMFAHPLLGASIRA